MLNNAQSRWLNRRQVISNMLVGIFIALMLSNVGAAETVPSAPAAVHHTIEISGFTFIPNRLEVAAGDMISWINKDIVPHNIAVNDGRETLSGNFKKGEKFTLQVKGSLLYICGLHPNMKGEVIVIEPSAHTQAAPCIFSKTLMSYANRQDRQVQRHITAFLALESHSERCL